MPEEAFYQYRVVLSQDEETGQVVALVPALDIADFGADAQEALKNVQEMIAFHLECLLEEGQIIPEERLATEGVYVRVRLPAHAS